MSSNNDVLQVAVSVNLPPANQVDQVGTNIIIPPALHSQVLAPKLVFASHTWHSTLRREPNSEELARLTTHFEALEAQVCLKGQCLVRVIPSLNVLIIEDIETKTCFEKPAETLEGEAGEAYFKLKTAFCTKYPGSPAYQSRFRDGKHFNTAGAMLKPRIVANPDPRVFMSQRLPSLLQGRTDEEKMAILERIAWIDIYIGKKREAYKAAIIKVQSRIKQTENPEEKQKLQNDLAKLQKRYNELQEIDPNALYWLAVFSGDDPEKRAEFLQKAVKTATGNKRLATELALVLVDGRVAQHDFCARNGIGVKNTELLHNTFWQITEKRVPEEDSDIYETNFVRDEAEALNKNIETQLQKLQERMENDNLSVAQKTDPRYFTESILQENKLSALTFNQKFLPQLIPAQRPDLRKAFAERVAIAEKLLDRRIQYQALGLEEEAEKLNLDRTAVYWLLAYHSSGAENIEKNAKMLEEDATRVLKDPTYAKLLANLLRERYAENLIKEVKSIKAETDPQEVGANKALNFGNDVSSEVLSIERGAYQSAVNILVHGWIPGYTVQDRVNGAALQS